MTSDLVDERRTNRLPFFPSGKPRRFAWRSFALVGAVLQQPDELDQGRLRLRLPPLADTASISESELEVLQAINATPPWLRYLVGAQQRLAFANVATGVLHDVKGLELSFDITRRVGERLVDRRGYLNYPAPCATHQVTWRSHAWAQLTAERNAAKLKIAAHLAAPLAAAVKQLLEHKEAQRRAAARVERAWHVLGCGCKALLMYTAAALAVGVGMAVYYWGWQHVTAHVELCDCELAPGPANVTACAPSCPGTPGCCAPEQRAECEAMRDDAEHVFWLLLLIAAVKSFLSASCSLFGSEQKTAEERSEFGKQLGSCLMCIPTCFMVYYWISLLFDNKDSCTEDSVYGTHIILWAPFVLIVAWCGLVCCCVLGGSLLGLAAGDD